MDLKAHRRYAVAAAACLGAAAVFTAVAQRRLGGRALSAPNLLTLSRAGAAAMACGTAFSGRGRRSSLAALLLGCTVCDWLDGPLARRLGASRLGAVLDLEADSWLTLWGAVAAVRLNRLPAVSMLAPALRYPLVAGTPAPPLRPWQRAAGVAQMVVVAGALSPWPPPRALARAVAAFQLAALAATAVGYRRPDAATSHDVPAPRVGHAGPDRPLRRTAP